ncbi:MAG: hypothetical protein FJ144_11290 [Deltaproteobacteria bacterium]|nr:hypothetical protein [Deltaproteobacteria bacterium]
MTHFARCFLLVFVQLGVGGLLSLAVPPFNDIARGFYKSSAGVFFTMALAGGGGSIYLRSTRGAEAVGTGEAILWAVFLVLFALYLSTLWGDAMVARARLFVASLGIGILALGTSAVAVAGGDGGLLAVLAVANALAGAGALGSVTSGMLIGHWYLIDPGMEIEPFRRCFRYFVATVVIELGLLAVVAIAVLLGAAQGGAERFAAYWHLAAMRLVLGPFATLAMAAMIQRVLAIPQTMAATGLFYIATLAVLVGSFLGRYFTFRTGLPF